MEGPRTRPPCFPVEQAAGGSGEALWIAGASVPTPRAYVLSRSSLGRRRRRIDSPFSSMRWEA